MYWILLRLIGIQFKFQKFGRQKCYLIFKYFKEFGGKIDNLKSRSMTASASLTDSIDLILELRTTPSGLTKILDMMKTNDAIIGLNYLPLVTSTTTRTINTPTAPVALKSVARILIPLSIWDLDSCNHLNIKYEPDIDSRHPVSISSQTGIQIWRRIVTHLLFMMMIGFLGHGISQKKTRNSRNSIFLSSVIA
jgi:hypothetical protein